VHHEQAGGTGFEYAFLDEQAAHSDGVWAVDLQQMDGRSPDGRMGDELTTAPGKVFSPRLTSWVEQRG